MGEECEANLRGLGVTGEGNGCLWYTAKKHGSRGRSELHEHRKGTSEVFGDYHSTGSKNPAFCGKLETNSQFDIRLSFGMRANDECQSKA